MTLESQGVRKINDLVEDAIEKAKEKLSSSFGSLGETPIDVSMLSSLTGYALTDEFVSKNLYWLQDNFSYLSNIYGFDKFYDMYLYAKSDSIVKATSKRKDTSKLNLVHRTVIRNGKPTELSFYEDPNEKSKKPKDTPNSDNQESDEKAPQVVSGKFYAGPIFGSPSIGNIKKAKAPESWMSLGKYKENSYDFIFYVENDEIVAVFGISSVKNILSINYVAIKNSSSFKKYYYQAIMDMTNEAYNSGMGVELRDLNNSSTVINQITMDFFGVKQKQGKYLIKPEDGELIFGERIWKG